MLTPGKIRIGVVEPDPLLRRFIRRIITDACPSVEIVVGHSIPEVDHLIYNVCLGTDLLDIWRAKNRSSRLILLVETAQDGLWEKLHSYGAEAVLPIPFRYQQLRSAITQKSFTSQVTPPHAASPQLVIF